MENSLGRDLVTEVLLPRHEIEGVHPNGFFNVLGVDLNLTLTPYEYGVYDLSISTT